MTRADDPRPGSRHPAPVLEEGVRKREAQGEREHGHPEGLHERRRARTPTRSIAPIVLAFAPAGG